MIAPLSSQLFGFAVSIAAGFLLGALYDVLRIWRIFFRTEKQAAFFQDVFYMALAAVFTFLLALAVSDGEIRSYLLTGEAAGWFAYYLSVGRLTGCLARWISRVLYRFVFDPLGRLFQKIRMRFVRVCHIFLDFLLKLAQRAKKRLKHRHKVVYNHSNGISISKEGLKGLHNHESHQRAKAK